MSNGESVSQGRVFDGFNESAGEVEDEREKGRNVSFSAHAHSF